MSTPLSSRPAPKVVQQEAIAAQSNTVLPVSEGSITYSVFREVSPTGETHYAEATESSALKWRTVFFEKKYIPHLETGVQTVYVVDLYLEDSLLCISLENVAVVKLNKTNGKLMF